MITAIEDSDLSWVGCTVTVSVHPDASDAPIADVTSSVTVYGSQFEPGLTVAFGSEYPTRPTSLDPFRCPG